MPVSIRRNRVMPSAHGLCRLDPYFRSKYHGTAENGRSFIQHISRSQLKTIITITSKMGSVTDNRGGGSYIYRSSKSAVNIVMKSLSIDLSSHQITAVLLHPDGSRPTWAARMR